LSVQIFFSSGADVTVVQVGGQALFTALKILKTKALNNLTDDADRSFICR
jgi:hypothetical protein